MISSFQHCSTVPLPLFNGFLSSIFGMDTFEWMDILIYISYMGTINIPTELKKNTSPTGNESSRSRFRAGVQPQEELECHPKPCGITSSRDVSPGLGLHSTWRSLIPLNRQQSVNALFSKFTLCVTGLSNHWKVVFCPNKIQTKPMIQDYPSIINEQSPLLRIKH